MSLRFSEVSGQFDSTSNKFINGFFDAHKDHKERINKYRILWGWYSGRHWNAGSVDAETIVTLNYVKRIVDELIVFFVKDTFHVSIPEDPNESSSSTVDRSFIKTALDDVWDANSRETFIHEAAQMSAVTGDCFIKVSLDTNEDEEQYIRLDVLPSSLCYPEFYADDKKRIERFHFMFPKTVETMKFTRFSNSRIEKNATETRITWCRETFTKDSIEYYEDDVLIEKRTNALGMIPVVHIKNSPNTDSCYGWSDVEILVSPNKAMNECVTNMSRIVDSYAFPQLFATGMRIEDITKDPGKVWSTANENADIKVLKALDDLKPSIEYFNTLYRSLFDLSGVPEQAINPSKNVSNTPGVALHMAYLPLINQRLIKIRQFSDGLKRVNKIILRMMEVLDPAFKEKLSKFGVRKYNTVLSFGEDLPRDEVQAISNDQQKLDMGITTRKDILLREGVGPQDADRIINEADAELDKRLAIKAKYSNKADEDGFGKRAKPDPVVQGDKVSRQ